MQWCRLYHEFATDPKVQMMPEAMQRRLIMLFCFQADGSLETMDEETLGFAMRLDAAEMRKTKELFVKKGFLDKDSWIPRNWDKRQRSSDDSYERVKRYRERNGRVCNESETLQKPKKSSSSSSSNVTKRLLAGAPPRDRPRPPLSASASASVLVCSESGGSPEGGEISPPIHSTDSAEAVKVRDDAVRRWGAIDIDADQQVNELIRCWGAPLAAHGLDKAYRGLGAKKRPWVYANTVCQGGLPVSDKRPMPGRHVSPSGKPPPEPEEPPPTPAEVREQLESLKAIPKRMEWQNVILGQLEEALAKLEDS